MTARSVGIFVLSLLLACAGKPPRPDWTVRGAHPAYPNERFLVGLGQAKVVAGDEVEAKRLAELDALNQIVSQIKVTIAAEVQTSLKAVMTLTAGKSEETSEQTFAERITAKTNLDGIEGVTVVQRHRERDVLFALAVLEREKGAFSLAARINERRAAIGEGMASAETALKEGKVYQALASLFPLRGQLEDLAATESIHRVVAGRVAEPWGQPVSMAQLEAKVTAVVTALSLRKVSGDAQRGALGTALGKPLIAKLEYGEGKGKKKNAVPGFPMRCRMAEGSATLTETLVSEADGTTTCRISATIPSGTRHNRVVLEPDLSALGGGNFVLVPPSAEFGFTLPTKADVRILVQVVEKNHGKVSASATVQPALAAAITAAGFRVVDKPKGGARALSQATPELAVLRKSFGKQAEFLVYGDISTALLSQPGPDNRPPFWTSEAHGFLRLVDLRHGVMLQAFDLAPFNPAAGAARSPDALDTRGFGNDQDTSGLKALQTFSSAATPKVVTALEQAFGTPPVSTKAQR
ncbi:MAG: hypothetical protein A2284_19240 [Deltaproteobacteria bacterium RIFOXYA12_FULL_61_11]|nr:MAG: hypothetical protein A2284_19240 [Deltaproteobacteria bacterium RIFOXYA12_FULL_61_11]